MQLQISQDLFLSLTPTQAKKQEPIPHTKLSLKLPTFKTETYQFFGFLQKKKKKRKDGFSLLIEIRASLFPLH